MLEFYIWNVLLRKLGIAYLSKEVIEILILTHFLFGFIPEENSISLFQSFTLIFSISSGEKSLF